MKKFLKDAATEVEMIFNATCAFPAIQEVVSQGKTAMTEGFTLLRIHSALLCDREAKSMTETILDGNVVLLRCLLFILSVVKAWDRLRRMQVLMCNVLCIHLSVYFIIML